MGQKKKIKKTKKKKIPGFFKKNSPRLGLLIFQGMDAAGKMASIKHLMSRQPGRLPRFSVSNSQVRKNGSMIFFGARTSACRNAVKFGNLQSFLLWGGAHCSCASGDLQGRDSRMNYWTKGQFGRDDIVPIVDMEKHLHRNGTRSSSFLHLSKEETANAVFSQRIDVPDKNWKFSPPTSKNENNEALYESVWGLPECTSTTTAPWHIIPADDKENARLIVSHIVLDSLKQLKMAYPKADNAAARNYRRFEDYL